jgi:two-component system NtrC family sensor kinase
VPTLHVLRGPDKGQTFHIRNEPSVLGRSAEHVALNDNTVSREHAELKPSDSGWMLVDRGSSNGTHLNGVRIQAPTYIKHGDQIKVGSTLMVFSGDDSIERFSGPSGARDLVDLDAGQAADSSILSAVSSAEDSVILAAPETADAVHAWNVMYRIAEIIGGVEAVDEFLEHVTDILFDQLPVDRVFILMREGDSDEFSPQVVRYRSKSRGKRTKITASRTIVNHVIEKREGILCANVLTDPRFVSNAQDGSIQGLGLRSIICVPIVTRDRVEGVIHVDCSMLHHVYTHDQLRLVGAIGRMVGLTIENVRLLESRVQNERMAAMGETVAHLSHHIRNILQGLRSGADVIELGLRNQKLEPIDTGWQIVQRNLDRTMLLTTNMLTFSKPRQAVFEVEQLNKVIEDVANLSQGLADDKGVMLLTDLEDLPPLPIDADGIHQVLLNLVINAIDACPSEGGSVNVKSSYDAVHSRVLVTVGDNGPGIPPDEIKTIFKAFHSTKGHGGTGLGLAAAKKVMGELQGTIEVTSAHGEGTTFTVGIPVTRSPTFDSDKTISVQRNPGSSPGLPRR